MFLQNLMILNHEKITVEKISNTIDTLIKSNKTPYDTRTYVFYNPDAKWIPIYEQFIDIENTSKGFGKYVEVFADLFDSAAVSNQVIESDTLVMAISGSMGTDVYIKGNNVTHMVNARDKKMDIAKWMPYFDCGEDEITRILKKRYDSENERVKALGILLRYDDTLWHFDVNSVDYLLEHYKERLSNYQILQYS